MEKQTEKQQPEKKFRSGGVVATVWKNIKKVENVEIETYSVNLARSYKDKEDKWVETNNYNINDVQKAILVLKKAQEFLLLKEE